MKSSGIAKRTLRAKTRRSPMSSTAQWTPNEADPGDPRQRPGRGAEAFEFGDDRVQERNPDKLREAWDAVHEAVKQFTANVPIDVRCPFCEEPREMATATT